MFSPRPRGPGPSAGGGGGARPSSNRDAGFSLLEIMVTIGLMVVVMTIAVGSWNQYAKARAQQGAADAVQAVLRQAQQRAVTEGRSTCVLFQPSTTGWTLYRGACDDAAKTAVESDRIDESYVRFSEASFTSELNQQGAGVTFRPRGTATPGRVVIERDGTATTRQVNVEGLTGRVSLD